ncbi:hypothetical protein PHET_05089 [Paragonimus heterotremus]|uniref:receptor protein-tyrosine kinase n=1 Tax=Paragonimus heterotremus TaxID=100268 RepID=A0A8J4T0I3_9TREM|nr:hypothetical protein PHET_05089 [Paragonimus heterotremus]
MFLIIPWILLSYTSIADANSPVCSGGCGPRGRCIFDSQGKSVCVCQMMYSPEGKLPPPQGNCKLSPGTIAVCVVLGLLILALIITMIVILIRGQQRKRLDQERGEIIPESVEDFR